MGELDGGSDRGNGPGAKVRVLVDARVRVLVDAQAAQEGTSLPLSERVSVYARDHSLSSLCVYIYPIRSAAV